MSSLELCAVTGASGFSGRSIARRLLSRGKRVLNIHLLTTPLLAHTCLPGKSNPS
ncbi:MAG: NAD-dependent epimerase/dehydratase family protein [Armatimonadota bacterium]|nr:hypothetical protein [bacterium]